MHSVGDRGARPRWALRRKGGRRVARFGLSDAISISSSGAPSNSIPWDQRGAVEQREKNRRRSVGLLGLRPATPVPIHSPTPAPVQQGERICVTSPATGRTRQARPPTPRKSSRGNSAGKAKPARRQSDQRRDHGFPVSLLHHSMKARNIRLAHNSGIAPLEPMVPPAQSLAEEIDRRTGLPVLGIEMRPGADQAELRRSSSLRANAESRWCRRPPSRLPRTRGKRSPKNLRRPSHGSQ